MLVAMDGISTKQRPDLVFLAVSSSNADGVVELLAEGLPFGEYAGCIDLAIIILLIGNGDHIAILIRHAISSDQQRTEMQLDGFSLIRALFGVEGREINLYSLADLLV